jgi:hypothetical protein
MRRNWLTVSVKRKFANSEGTGKVENSILQLVDSFGASILFSVSIQTIKTYSLSKRQTFVKAVEVSR